MCFTRTGSLISLFVGLHEKIANLDTGGASIKALNLPGYNW